MIPGGNIIDAVGLSLVGTLLVVMGIVVFLQNPRSHIHHSFSGIMAGVYLIFLLEVLRLITADPQTLLLSYRLTFGLAVMVVATILYFAQVFPDDPELPIFWRNAIFLTAAGLALFAAFTDQAVAGLSDQAGVVMGPQVLRAGPLNIWLRLFFLVYLMISVYTLFYKWVRARGVNKIKLGYILLSFLIGGGLILIPLIILPSHEFESYHFAAWGGSLGALIALWGIMRYRIFRVMPYTAAEQILDNLVNSVLVLDLDGRIVFGQVKDADELEPLLRPVVEMVIAGRRADNYRINFKGRYISVNARFISEGGGVLIILNDISEIEKSLTEQDLIREKLVRRLEKETIIRRTLSALAQVKDAEEIRSIIPPVEISSDPELMQAISRLEKATRNRLEILAKSQSDRRELLKKVEEAERVYNAGVQRELEVVELREKIRKLKEAKGIL